MDLTLREKIGQRFAAGFPETELTPEFKAFLAEYKIGNIILFKENIVDKNQLRTLCAKLQEEVRRNTGHGAFITIDQEGGGVIRLTEDCANVPGAMAVAATGDPANARLAGRITGRELHALGINFNLAPDMDINSNPGNPVIGVRSYGDTPEQVALYALEMAKGLMEEQVLACAKHFPGHGDTAMDSHLSLPKVEKSKEELMAMEFYPFLRAVEAGIPAIMTTHILFPALEPEEIPATMSRRIVNGLLREEFGFRGLVLSDCMEMGAIKQYYGTPEGCLAAIKAGVDIVFVSHHADVARQAIRLVEEAVAEGTLPAENLDASMERILYWKKDYADQYGPVGEAGTEENRRSACRLLHKTITAARLPQGKVPALGDNPFFAGCYPFRVTLASNEVNRTISFPEEMAKRLGGSAFLTPSFPQEEDIAQAAGRAAGHSSIVLGTYNSHLAQGQAELLRRLADEAEAAGVPMIVIALRNPYDLRGLPENITAIAAWEYTERSILALADILAGQRLPEGKMPVSL